MTEEIQTLEITPPPPPDVTPPPGQGILDLENPDTPIEPPVVQVEDGLWNYTVYRKSSGRIIRTCQGGKSDPVEEESGFLEGHFSALTQWIDDTSGTPIVKEKTDVGVNIDKLTITLGETTTITNIPSDVTIHVSDQTVPYIDDGILTITPQTIGLYHITIDDAPYAYEQWELIVND